jgi:hypothetical protein
MMAGEARDGDEPREILYRAPDATPFDLLTAASQPLPKDLAEQPRVTTPDAPRD